MSPRSSWQSEIRHEGLNKYRVIRGLSQREVQLKAEAQMALWEDMWERRQQTNHKAVQRELLVEAAAEMTAYASGVTKRIENILHDSLAEDRAAQWWDRGKDTSQFPKPAPHQTTPFPRLLLHAGNSCV